MNDIIRIGTRQSQLAMWQANTVAKQLQELGYKTELIKVTSVGDQIVNKPIYEIGIEGVFTKNLDVALLNDKIDIAVHSLKDVPTKLPLGIVQSAVLKRGSFDDVLVLKSTQDFLSNKTAVIATGSMRRKAHWLHRYPNHSITGLRGNVNTRLQKLKDNNWDGIILAKAGLERIDLLPDNHLTLDWMVPAPGQGAIMIATLQKNKKLIEICNQLNDDVTEKCVTIEREFLNGLNASCTSAIGALAVINNQDLHFKGVIFSPDGKNKIEYSKTVPLNKNDNLGKLASEYILSNGGDKILKQELNPIKKKIVSTKVLTESQEAILANKYELDSSNFISIELVPLNKKSITGIHKNVIITSQNAVESILNSFNKSDLNFTNIYCVGNKTKQLIERHFGTVKHSENSAEELAKYLSEELPDNEKITFFCGSEKTNEFHKYLNPKNIDIQEILCYNITFTPTELIKNYDAIVFYSPSGVKSYLKLNSAENKTAFCIGNTTYKEASKYFKKSIVAKETTIASTLESVNDYYENE